MRVHPLRYGVGRNASIHGSALAVVGEGCPLAILNDGVSKQGVPLAVVGAGRHRRAASRAPRGQGLTPCGNKKERGGSNPALSAIYFSVSHRSSNAKGGQARARTETKMYHQNEFIATYPFMITIL